MSKFAYFTDPWNGECPAGYYCMEETDSPSACPEGTISPNLRLQSVDECLNCTAGYYCNETGTWCLIVCSKETVLERSVVLVVLVLGAQVLSWVTILIKVFQIFTFEIQIV